jgi:hypothetical protein
MAELDHQTQLNLIEHELREALRQVAALRREEETAILFRAQLLRTSASKAVQYVTELVEDLLR